MNWRHLRHQFQLFDTRGLEADTILTMRLLILGVMGGVIWGNITTGVAFTGFIKELGASDFLYGLVMALPPLANAFQFLASYLLERSGARKKMFLITGLIQRSVWLPFGLIPFFIPMQAAGLRVWMAVLMVMVSSAMGPFMNVSFFSICNDVIPLRTRGRYFAVRSRISTMVGLAAGLLVGVLLDKMPGFSGYAVAFTLASVTGLMDVISFFFMRLPPSKPAPAQTGLLRMMRVALSDRRYIRTVLGMTAWMFSVQLCAPYFNVFMRTDMGLNNFQMILVSQIISNLFLVLMVSRWGAALDQYGNKPTLRVAAFLTSFSPILWVFVGEGMMPLALLANALSGATYVAIDLGAQNLFMGQARGENKSMYFAVYFFFTQLAGLALGSTVGGWLLDNLLCRVEVYHWVLLGTRVTRYNLLFALSGVLRLVVVLTLLGRIDEENAQSERVLVQNACRTVLGHLKLLYTQIMRRHAALKLKHTLKRED